MSRSPYRYFIWFERILLQCSFVVDPAWHSIIVAGRRYDMVSPESTVPINCRHIISDAVVPIYARIGADIGHAFWFEERYFLNRLRYTDLVAYRKRARKSGYFEQLADDWELERIEFQYGSTAERRFSTTVFSSRFLLAWLLQKGYQLRQGRAEARARLVAGALQGIFFNVQKAASRLPALPSITVRNCTLEVTDAGCVNLSALVAVYEDLPTEWDTLHRSGYGYMAKAGDFHGEAESRGYSRVPVSN